MTALDSLNTTLTEVEDRLFAMLSTRERTTLRDLLGWVATSDADYAC
ncbi:hypothetical protein SBI_01519 [Streptomyces bingchenggensis BCW-1]|uniref:Uncharacterized protein n=1 Tax=Streptomyces bingchenggensis (strain BCW-1) TaxID=749414 RepID=D7CDX5_STRBB|nr:MULTISPECIES: hypothetical protein [Streptomyces]ADI04640.1 hypothetical protein SBI_01519 [Streptomyces bingchenggensis BCW-1]